MTNVKHVMPQVSGMINKIFAVIKQLKMVVKLV
jgi:hypothetical protein